MRLKGNKQGQIGKKCQNLAFAPEKNRLNFNHFVFGAALGCFSGLFSISLLVVRKALHLKGSGIEKLTGVL